MGWQAKQNKKKVAHLKTWDQLTEKEKGSIELMLRPLIEFSYGFEQLQSAMLGGAKDDSAIIRFYSNALYNYCANFFTIKGDNKLAGAMKRLGLESLLEPINKILETPMESITFGKILDIYRDKMLTHNPFTDGSILDEIYNACDLTEPENNEKLLSTAWKLFIEVQNLAIQLTTMYPESEMAKISKPKEK